MITDNQVIQETEPARQIIKLTKTIRTLVDAHKLRTERFTSVWDYLVHTSTNSAARTIQTC